MQYRAIYKYEVYITECFDASSKEEAERIAESLDLNPDDYEVLSEEKPTLVEVREVE